MALSKEQERMVALARSCEYYHYNDDMTLHEKVMKVIHSMSGFRERRSVEKYIDLALATGDKSLADRNFYMTAFYDNPYSLYLDKSKWAEKLSRHRRESDY